MNTRIIKGTWPAEITRMRQLRIEEGLSFPTGTETERTHNKICDINGEEAYFLKPGKEYFREGDAQNINDMTPFVGDKYIDFSFRDIWRDLLRMSFVLSETRYKQLYVLIYRLAFFLDCKVIDGKVRYCPDEDVQAVIEDIQREMFDCGAGFDVMQFITFLDLVGWNEDIKYQVSRPVMTGKAATRNQGRINNILSMISIPLILRQFVENTLENKDNPEEIDFYSIIDIAQQFARTRGVSPISNKELVERLSPYLSE